MTRPENAPLPSGGPARRHGPGSLLAAAAVLAAGLALSLGGWRNADQLTERLARERFEARAGEISMAIMDRLETYEMALRGGQAMFAAMGQVSREQWRDYVGKLNVLQNYPGVQGIGYTQLVRPEDLASHQRAIRAQGFPDYALQPAGARPVYTAIIYLEPFDARNRKAFGYDMFSEPVRRAAMERARDTGNSIASGRVTLMQEADTGVQAGFLLYLPCYLPKAPVFTVEERRAALHGYVYSPFRMKNLMRGILGKSIPGLGLEVYDGDASSDSSLLFRSDAQEAQRSAGRQPLFEVRRSTHVFERPWLLVFQSLPDFEAGVDRTVPRMVLLGGISISLLLALIAYSLLSTRAKALSLAEAMTVELRKSGQRFKNLADFSPVGVFETDAEGGCLFVNKRWQEFSGLSQEQALGRGWVNAIHPDDMKAVLVEWAEAMKTSRDFNLEYRFLTPDGRITWLMGSAAAYRDAAGEVRGYFGSVMDIGKRVKAEEALRESEVLLSSVLDSAVDPIFTADAQGRILTANPAACATFGYSLDELVGRKLNMLMPEPFHSEHDTYLERYASTGVAHVIGKGGREVHGRRKDGALIPFDISVSEFLNQGERRYTGILRDVSERVRAREAMQVTNAALQERQARLDADLEAAAEIQRSLLPKQGTCSLGFEADFRFMPSATIGGDIFNMICLGPEHTGLYMVDVSGHGVPAALVSVSVAQELSPTGEVLMDRLLDEPRRPDDVLRLLDTAFPMERFDKFFSMFYLVYEPRTGKLSYCNAGHPPPMLLRAGGDVELLEEGGTLVGMDLGQTYAQGEVRVSDGDTLLLYTDGVTELEDPANRQFGPERLEALLQGARGASPEQVLQTLTGTLLAHADGRPPDDDISLVCVRFNTI